MASEACHHGYPLIFRHGSWKKMHSACSAAALSLMPYGQTLYMSTDLPKPGFGGCPICRTLRLSVVHSARGLYPRSLQRQSPRMTRHIEKKSSDEMALPCHALALGNCWILATGEGPSPKPEHYLMFWGFRFDPEAVDLSGYFGASQLGAAEVCATA